MEQTPRLHSLWNPTPINMEWFRKYIIEKKHIWTCIPVMALFKTQQIVIQYHNC
jgi:hypothetical protein